MKVSAEVRKELKPRVFRVFRRSLPLVARRTFGQDGGDGHKHQPITTDIALFHACKINGGFNAPRIKH
jgi:hypothetical protein